MPLSALAAAAISAGTQVGSNMLNNANSRRAQNNAFDLQMKSYDRQRADALADRSFENEYNSPAAQMARLKAAGLNPNLVYGSGGATVNSSNTRGSSGNAPQQQVSMLQLDILGPILETMRTNADVMKSLAQNNLLIEQAETQKEEQLLKSMQSIFTANKADDVREDIRRKTRENYQGDELNATSIEFGKQRLAKLKADTTYTLDQNERQEVLKQNTVAKTLEEILTMRMARAKTKEEMANLKQVRDNLMQDERIKKFEEQLNKTGLTKNDNVIFRVYEKLLETLLN
ncbi:MAG: hypothetical protein ACOVQA_05020 [Thermoflexibacteraceae bacterium]